MWKGNGKHGIPFKGTRHPAFSGISKSNIARMQYMTAECTTEIGAFRFPRTSDPVPVKSSVAEPVSVSISTLRWIWMGGRKQEVVRKVVLMTRSQKLGRPTHRRSVVQVIDRRQNVRPSLLDHVPQEIAH